MADDGLAYVKASNDKTGLVPGTKVPKHKMGGDDGLVDIPNKLLESCIEASEECPGECIFIEEVSKKIGAIDVELT